MKSSVENSGTLSIISVWGDFEANYSFNEWNFAVAAVEVDGINMRVIGEVRTWASDIAALSFTKRSGYRVAHITSRGRHVR